MAGIEWLPRIVRLGDLKPWENNPRKISKKQAKRLLRSWEQLGQFQTIAIGPDGEVYDGHQRLSVLLTAYGSDYQVLALQASRPLTEEERKSIVLQANNLVGEWDWSILRQWDRELLKQCGFDKEIVARLHHDIQSIHALLTNEKTAHLRRVISPIYEPRGNAVSISELYDDRKTRELLEEIDHADIPDDVKSFLRLAAYRHTIFFFDRIADYYASATPTIQRLMEHSALIIIDFNQAIEQGLVKFLHALEALIQDEENER